MTRNRRIYLALIVLLAVSAAMRGFLAAAIELGNDEVYYLLYALFPDWSHFDHPPMIGWVIRVFTFDLAFTSEFFVRLAAVVCGTLSTWLIFLVGKQVKDALTGLYAAMLYTASFYGFILSGTFILPDAPQVCFWMAALLFLLRSMPDKEGSGPGGRDLILAALFTGLALLSKYHSVFLVAGMAAFVLFYNRNWLRRKEFYLFFVIVAVMAIPVIYWNFKYHFISFTYHENRVTASPSGLQPKFLLTELAGEFFYNNPVNVLIILAALVALISRKRFISTPAVRLLLWTSLPLILVFQSFSLFRSTLPHWTGPGYLGLMVIAAAFLSGTEDRERRPRLVPWQLVVSLVLLLSVAALAVGQINHGWIRLGKGRGQDPTRDLYGWEQLGKKFDRLANSEKEKGGISRAAPVLAFRWFPAANFDYYLGRKTLAPVYALGTLERVHKYYWINHFRGTLPRGSDAWFIALSDDYGDPVALYGDKFKTIIPTDTLYITRGRDTIREAYVYRLLYLKAPMTFPSPERIAQGKVE